MGTFIFDQIDKIQEFQFLTDTSGILLDANGALYKFKGKTTELINTPEDFKVSKFHFINENEGAIIGNGTVKTEKGSLDSQGWLGDEKPFNNGNHCVILACLILLVLAIYKVSGAKKRATGILASGAGIILIASLIFSCSNNWQAYKTQDPNSDFITIINSDQLIEGWSIPHTYFANKDLKSFISTTHDKGNTWTTNNIPTNFHLTALTAIGNNFFVGTFANEKQGDLTIHGDGDVCIYGNDSTFSPRLSGNDNISAPFLISAQRGVKGFKSYPKDSLFYVFGTETEPVLPKDEVSSTEGNIFQIPTDLNPDYRIINAPDSVAVQSLSRSVSGDLWVVLDNKELDIIKGRTVYNILKNKRLFRLKNGNWVEISINNINSFEQIEFIPNTGIGYALAESGELYETLNEGVDWRSAGLNGIRKIQSWNNSLTLLKDKNVLMLYNSLSK